jgi:hypothetical protein
MSVDRALLLLAWLSILVLAAQVWRLSRRLEVVAAGNVTRPAYPRLGARLSFDEGPDFLLTDRFSDLRTGEAVAVILQPGCVACKRVKQELTDSQPPLATFVFMGDRDWADRNTADHLEADDGFRLDGFLPMEPLKSFGYADAFPVLMTVKNGVVTSTAHRLVDLTTL